MAAVQHSSVAIGSVQVSAIAAHRNSGQSRLEEFKASHSIHSFLLDGAAGYSPITAHIAEQFPIIHWMVPTYIDADDGFHTHTFLSYYLSDIADLRDKPDDATSQLVATTLAKACHAPAARTTSAYSVRLIDDIAVVTFRSTHSQRCQD